MKIASRQTIFMFVYILGMSTSASYAGCTELQGVTLCDNGDREVIFEDVTYTSRAGELAIRSTEANITEFYSHDGYFRLRCYRQNTLYSQANNCYSFMPYYGDLADQ